MSLVSIIGLYEQFLLDASYRGIPFSIVNTTDEPGRRVQQFMFPGSDAIEFQDLGAADSDIVVKGIVAGDDFIDQAERLRAAFWTKGVATLSHPWLGEIQVLQSPGRPPRIEMSSEHLRIVTFTLTVRRLEIPVPAAPDTLQSLLNTVNDLGAQARVWLRNLLAPIARTLALVSATESLIGGLTSTVLNVALAFRDPLSGLTGGLPIALLSSLTGSAPGPTYGDSVADGVAGVSDAIVALTTPPIPSAVAPGGVVTATTPIDGRITADALLIIAASVAPEPTDSGPLIGVRIAVTGYLLGGAMQAASDISYDSQQEATAWRDRVAVALDGAATLAASLVPIMPTDATLAWRALVAARSAWMADMNATIGRLPAVRHFTPPGAAPVWLIAHYLSGDQPAQMVGRYLDLVARNDIVDPGAFIPGPLEVLE